MKDIIAYASTNYLLAKMRTNLNTANGREYQFRVLHKEDVHYQICFNQGTSNLSQLPKSKLILESKACLPF